VNRKVQRPIGGGLLNTIVGKTVFFLTVAFGLFTGQAQTFTDDFNDNTVDPTKWGAAVNTGNGRLLEQNQRVDYTVSAATGTSDASLRPWVGQLPLTANWEATLQVHNAFNAGGANYKWAAVGLQLKRPGNTNEYVFIELYAEQSGNSTSRGFLTSLETPDALYGDVISEDLGTTDASVKLSWDSSTGILITSYDRDGAGGTYDGNRSAASI
jgi:hypothetical protein